MLTTDLTVGVFGEIPRYNFVNKKGELDGFDLDIIRKAVSELGCKAIFKKMPFEKLEPSLLRGDVDMIISGMGMSQERLNKFAMVPYLCKPTNAFGLVFLKTSTGTPSSLEEFKESTVAVITKTRPEKYLAAKKVEKLPLEDEDSVKTCLKAHKAAAALLGTDAAIILTQDDDNFGYIEIPVEKEFQVKGIGIGICKERTSLFAKMTKVIEELNSSGFISECDKKWNATPGH